MRFAPQTPFIGWILHCGSKLLYFLLLRAYVFQFKIHVLMQSFVIVHVARIGAANFTSWTPLFPSRPVVTVKELHARKLFTMLQQETLTVPAS